MIMLLLIFFLHSSSAMPFDIIRNIFNYYTEYPPFPEAFEKDDQVIDKSYDFVIIGAGTGGSVVANRLSENKNWRILLLEAGKEEIFLTDFPLLAPAMHITAYNWGYRTQPHPKNPNGSGGYCLSMIDGRCNWPRGKAVGGTSVINFMIHSRGSKRDFDNWEKAGNPGWSYQDVYPYFKKSEKAMFRKKEPGTNEDIYGKNGYLDVTTAPWTSELRDYFLKAGEEIGYSIKDCNEDDATGFCPVKVNLRHGRRVSAAKAYLRPIRQRSNFHLSKYSRVTRVIIDPIRKMAVGVEFIKNGKMFFVKAKKEVILSAGSLNSPQILMLSGVGPKRHLDDIGVRVVEDLPIGFNLQDHVSMSALTFLVNDSVTIVEARVASNYKNTFDYLANGTGPFTVPAGAEALAFIHTKRDLRGIDDLRGLKELGGEIGMNFLAEKKYGKWKEEQDEGPDVELVFGVGSMAGDASGSIRSIFALPDKWYQQVFHGYEGEDAFSIVPILLHPKSRGRVSLKSSNPFDSPIFEANYYDDEEDIKTIVRGIKMV